MQDSDYIVSDEEISTNKERHSRLGADNLDDTLEYDFSGPALRVKELEQLQTKDDVPLPENAIDQGIKAQPDSLLMVKPILIHLISSSQGYETSSPCVSYLNAADSPAKMDSVGVIENKAN